MVAAGFIGGSGNVGANSCDGWAEFAVVVSDALSDRVHGLSYSGLLQQSKQFLTFPVHFLGIDMPLGSKAFKHLDQGFLLAGGCQLR